MWQRSVESRLLHLRKNEQKKKGGCLAGIAGGVWKQHRHLLVSWLEEKCQVLWTELYPPSPINMLKL